MSQMKSELRERLIQDLRGILGDDYETWLNAPNDFLGGHKPVNILDADPGKIKDLIAKIEYGLPS